MGDIRLRKSCGWEDTAKYQYEGDMFACVYTHEISLDLAVPERSIISSSLFLNQRDSRGMLTAPD